MRGYVRFILAVMLAAVAAVGSARGEEREWKKYNDGNITWLYQMVRGNGCSIKPASYRFGTPTLTIPSRVKGIGVVGVAMFAFEGCRTLTSVVIPEGVTTIENFAFEDCVNLREVSIPSSVTTIGLYAFWGCSGLTSVAIPKGVTMIEGNAFGDCSGLQRINVEPGNPRYYSEEGVLFTLVKDYKRGVDVKALMCYPNGRAGEYRIPSDVEMIGGRAFWGCSGLTKVTIPSSVTTIVTYTFMDCSRLASVKIPEGVTAIESDAFEGCSGLTKVTIPSSVTTVESGAFRGCSGLQRIEVAPGNPRYHDEEGVLLGLAKDPKSGVEVKALVHYPAGRSGEYRIPSDVEMIRGEAFGGCSGLTSVTIPSSVTTIEHRAFRGCSGLQRIEVEPGNPLYHDENGVLFGTEHDPMSGKEVKALIWYPMGRAGEYRIPGDVEMVASGVFSGCSKLTKVTFPGRIEFDGSAFDDSIALKEIAVESQDANDRYYTQDGVLFSSKEERTLVRCPLGKRGAYEIPSGVEVIGKGAFAGCSQLTDITIPTGVRAIGYGAFDSCSGLTRVALPATISSVSWFSFDGCSRLEEFAVDAANPYYRAEGGALLSRDGRIFLCYPEGRKGAYEIPQGVTNFESPSYCRSLTSLVVPSSLKEVLDGFWFCDNLSEVYWLARADISSENEVFYGISLGATLYVRPGEKPKVEAEEWAKRFSRIVEGHVVTFRDADGQPVGEQLVKPNGKARALDMQDKNGNAVVWLLNGAPYDFNAPVTRSITLQVGGSSTAVESALLAGVQAVSNPVVDVLELRGMGNAVRVEVYSVAGVQVHAGALQGEDRVQVDARGWASGVYVVRVVAHDGAKTLRVVKRD